MKPESASFALTETSGVVEKLLGECLASLLSINCPFSGENDKNDHIK